MPWSYDDDEIHGIVDANIKDSPPNPPAVNSAGSMRTMLKSYWDAIRGQVSLAVEGFDQQATDVQERILAAEELAESVYEEFQAKDEIGTYNAATNIASIRNTAGADTTLTLTTTPAQANGKAFRVVEEGTQSITGTSKLMKVGGFIISRNMVKWDYIPPSDTGYAKAVALEAVLPSIVDNETMFIDADGNVVAKIKADGTFEVVELNTKLVTVQSGGEIDITNGAKLKVGTCEIFATDQYDEVCYDSNGYIGFVRNLNGTVKMDTSLLVNKDSSVIESGFLADINHYIVYGQSLSIGGSTGSSLISSRTQVYNSLMFFGGTRPWNSAAMTRYSSLIALVEGVDVETPSTGIANMITQLVASQEGHDFDDAGWNYQVLVSCPGASGISLLGLSQGSAYYTRLLEDVSNGLALANAAGKTYNVPALSFVQGEADSGGNVSIYKQCLIKLRNDLNADIKAITGQNNDVVFILYQVASHNATMSSEKFPHIGIAHYELATEVDGFDLGAVMYPFEYQVDGIHLTNTYSLIMGLYQGMRMKRNVINGDRKNFLFPKRYVAQGNIIEIQFNVPAGPIVLDTTWITDPGHYGFRMYDSGGTEITITSVTVVRDNTLRIVLPSSVQNGCRLTYAINGTGTGRVAGSRGCLRDSQGATLTYNTGGVTWSMHNWCPIFQKTF